MPNDANLATSALDRLVVVLGEDAIYVLAGGAREAKEALESLVTRRGHAYAAAVQGQPLARMGTEFEAWMVEMARALAPVAPPPWIPMMDVVREKVTLELGARGLRSLFSSKPSEKDVARVKRYGTLAVRVLRVVMAADGPLDGEERTTIASVVASLGLPEADANALYAEEPVAPQSLDVYGELDPAIAAAVVRGAWLAAAWDQVDPREEQVIKVVAQKMGVANEELEAGRKEALARIDLRRKTGLAAVDGIRYVLSDRSPGLGVVLAQLAGTIMLPRRWRGEGLAPLSLGVPVALAKRHHGLDGEARAMVLGVAWAAALVDDPGFGRKALLRARWERFAEDLGEDDPGSRELVETWVSDALAGVARTLQ